MSQETETNDQLVNFDERAQHLESEYKTLIECEQTLLGYHKNIDDLLREIDEVVKDHELRWLKHREKYIQKLKENLQIAAGITLTQEETASLKDDYPTSLLNKRKELKKVGINYTKNATSYEILVHYILWQFLSRSFKKPEEEPRIFKTLLSLINEETTDRKKVLVVIKHKYDIIIDNICRLETKLEISTSSTLNSDQKLYNLKLK